MNEMKAAGFVTLALGWQTFEQEPSGGTIKARVEDGLKSLSARGDVKMNALGLTSFCLGGRSTMLLPQISRASKCCDLARV